MTIEREGKRPRVQWTSAAERVAVTAMLCFLAFSVVVAAVILGIYRDLDKATLGAVLGSVGTGAVTAISHKLSSRG